MMRRFLSLFLSIAMCFHSHASMLMTTAGSANNNGGDVQTTVNASTFALTNFTTCAWVRFQAAPNTTSAFKTIWARHNSGATSTELWWYLDTSGKVDVWINNGHTIGLQNTAITNTNWHHFCIAKASNVWTSFIDGVQDKQVTDATAQNNLSGVVDIRLGLNNDTNHACRCSMAEVGGWNTTLSQTELTALSKGVVPGYIRHGALLLWIPMYGRQGTGGSSGTATQDFSPNSATNSPAFFTRGGNVVTDDHCPGCSMPPGTN